MENIDPQGNSVCPQCFCSEDTTFFGHLVAGRSTGGQKCRWNDLVVRGCGLEEDWHV